MKDDNESFQDHKKRWSIANRGKSTEKKVSEALTELNLEYDRHYDTRAAGRPLPPAVADFTVYASKFVFMLEVKEVSKGTRLKKFVQRPRMLRRSKNSCCLGFVLVHFLEMGVWSLVNIQSLDDLPSWELGELTMRTGNTATAVLESIL